MEGGCVEMKKNYISPEAEMTKFEGIEEVMSESITGVPGLGGDFGVGDKPEGWD